MVLKFIRLTCSNVVKMVALMGGSLALLNDSTPPTDQQIGGGIINTLMFLLCRQRYLTPRRQKPANTGNRFF